MKCTQMFGKQEQLAGLNSIPLCYIARPPQTVRGQNHEKHRGTAITAIFEEFSKCTLLTQSLGMARIDTVRHEEDQYIGHGEPRACRGEDAAVQILDVPSLAQAGEAGSSDDVGGDVIGDEGGDAVKYVLRSAMGERFVMDSFSPAAERVLFCCIQK
mmetsp:Transcript_29816/g.63239  ORF Transcript_29816/g.63239 Transcript_29816/m.63239 type:complete len:157 (-) Transcript_29816:193-663(-)